MKITTFLMFDGQAEAAMNDYIALFPDSRVQSIERYGAGQAGKEGTVKLATIELAGMRVMCIDSPVKHAFTFTPAISLFVDVDSRAELDRLYAALGQGGQTLMPPNSYGFSTWFAWVQDKYGVSWQLNLP
jgi:predicted 3-demethylubiquinone-9 3-methyltransferase (glyoxalase superfamily)